MKGHRLVGPGLAIVGGILRDLNAGHIRALESSEQLGLLLPAAIG
jgi:hypothetical protein